jgi:dTDP-4-dehydrorhamnose 3,5-epimerase
VIVEEFDIPGPKAITPKRLGDQRGFFSEVFRRDLLAEAGITVDFPQENHSLSRRTGVIRGLHVQIAPRAQAKLVRVARGAVLDVAVDIRHGSPTFGQHVAVELSAENWKQLFVPAGFAHAFCTLTDEVEFLYKVSDVYSAECDRGLAFDDPDLGINWPVAMADAILSDRDRKHPRLRDLPAYFDYRALQGDK